MALSLPAPNPTPRDAPLSHARSLPQTLISLSAADPPPPPDHRRAQPIPRRVLAVPSAQVAVARSSSRRPQEPPSIGRRRSKSSSCRPHTIPRRAVISIAADFHPQVSLQASPLFLRWQITASPRQGCRLAIISAAASWRRRSPVPILQVSTSAPSLRFRT